MSLTELYTLIGNATYAAQAAVALWGAFCVVMIYRRIALKRFRNEDAQLEFLQGLGEPLERGEFDRALSMCEGDGRAVPQLSVLAIANRALGFEKVRKLIIDRFQRDVMADLEHRITWVNTVIKSAPMLGLFGTVLGMMGAFGKLAGAETVKPEQLAEDIALALITTAIGLMIAIPLVICMASVNIRLRKMEDLAISGLANMLDSLRSGLERRGKS